MKTGIIATVLLALLFAAFAGFNSLIGVGGWGPDKTQTITITRCYVDVSGSGDSRESHYMVGSDKGTFEVDNGLMLGVWNADDIYAKMREGRTYEVQTKGNRVVNFFMQEYPYIVAVREVEAASRWESSTLRSLGSAFWRCSTQP